MKIAVCGLIKSENLGEAFIASSLEYLIRTEAARLDPSLEIEFVEVDLMGKKDEIVETASKVDNRIKNFYGYSKAGLPMDFVYLRLLKGARQIKNHALQNAAHRVRHAVYLMGRNQYRRLYRYYDSKMHDVQFIVVDGAGLLEYSFNEYQELLYVLSRYAEDHGLDIVYNAIGRAGAYDESDYRATFLRKALRSKAVKYVSARDSVETVQQCAGEAHHVKLLADSAFWLSEAYPHDTEKRREKIGIGLIRGNALKGYGVNYRSRDWIDLFSGIARCLESRGYDYEFFTNGLPTDVRIGRCVIENLGLPEDRLVKRPMTGPELYETINGYRALITCRMHSSIAAFSLGIPAVILSWNDKVNKLMEIMGCPERAIDVKDFQPELIVDRMEKALQEGVDARQVQLMKDKARESVQDYIGLIVKAGR